MNRSTYRVVVTSKVRNLPRSQYFSTHHHFVRMSFHEKSSHKTTPRTSGGAEAPAFPPLQQGFRRRSGLPLKSQGLCAISLTNASSSVFPLLELRNQNTPEGEACLSSGASRNPSPEDWALSLHVITNTSSRRARVTDIPAAPARTTRSPPEGSACLEPPVKVSHTTSTPPVVRARFVWGRRGGESPTFRA